MSDKQEQSSNGSQFDPLNPIEDIVSSAQTPIIPEVPKVSLPSTPVKDEGMLDAILKEIETPTNISNTPQEIVISSLEDIIAACVQNGYDYFKFEPQETDVEVIFVKENRDAEKKFIKFPLYSTLTIKIKTITALDLTATDKVQEGRGETKVGGKTYVLSSKVAPGKLGESLFVKVKLQEVKVKKKLSFGQLISFFGATSFVAFVMGATFITFVILNAKTVDDVRFFNSLGISLNDINTFIGKIVFFIFSILVFIETVVLAVFLFKFYLTKKTEKSRKRVFGVISGLLLLITFSTAYAWLDLDKRISALPNWQEVAYGDVQIFDNEKLISDKFDKGGALLRDTTNLIGPITLKYDLSLFKKKQEAQGYKILKYKWDFGDKKTEEKLDPIMIKLLDKKGTYNVSLVVEEIDPLGKTIEKKVDNVKSVNISHIVVVKQNTLKNGGIQVEFDASDLKELGKIEWYTEDNVKKTQLVWSGSVFRPQKVFYDEELIGLYIRNDTKENENFDKVFVIAAQPTSDIGGNIVATQDQENDLLYTFKVKDIKAAFGEGFVSDFTWTFSDKSVELKADPLDVEGSSEIKHEFLNYGKQEIQVTLKDPDAKAKVLSLSINIVKIVKLKEGLKISDGENNPIDSRYEPKGNEYFINGLGIPAKLKFDARDVRADNFIYSLNEIYWDVGNDGTKEGKGKLFDYQIDKEGNYTISVEYVFKHRKIAGDTVTLTQKIYVEAIRKEAIIDFKLEKDSNYAPVMVRLDGSLSSVKDDNIIKFIYDYGDGIVDERGEAIVAGHLYSKSGEYTIKLTVQTEKGKKYSTSKKLVLSPKPQIAQIGVSMKTAPVGQGIDFNSDKSEGQIVSYLWKFGDGNDSTDANPTHAYKKAGIYEVVLRLGYANGNYQEDKLNITIE